MRITVGDLPKVIQAMMESYTQATVTEVKYFNSTAEIKNSGPPYQLSNSTKFPDYTIEKTLAQFDVFDQLDLNQKYLVMHMLGRNRDDIEADVNQKMSKGVAAWLPESTIMSTVGITESNSCIKTKNVRKIATTMLTH